MERKLFWGIATPSGIITIALGFWLISIFGTSILTTTWMQLKLLCVAVLIIYHIVCGKYLNDFKHDKNTHSHVWYRWFNELPIIAYCHYTTGRTATRLTDSIISSVLIDPIKLTAAKLTAAVHASQILF